MPNVLVLYYSSYGHIELMAGAQAEGAARIPNVRVLVKRVPETVPPEIAKTSGFKLDQTAPIANPEELEQYDAIIFGTPTRFGNMAAQMRNFLDQTGGLWARGALVGKVGSVFCSTASRDAALHELAHETNYAPTIGPIWRIILYSWRIKLSKPKFRPPSGTSRGTKSDPQCSVNPEFGIVSGLWRRT